MITLSIIITKMEKKTYAQAERWFAIVNPIAGRGRGLADWPQISSLLHQWEIDFDAHFTERKYHAIELAFGAAGAGYKGIIVVGGDGTLHETVCGVMMQNQIPSTDITLAVVAVGTGNDWMRMFGIPRSYSDAIRSIKQGQTLLQDVGRVTYFESMVAQERYLSNVGGVAYDAAVCRGVNRLKEKGHKGTGLYLWTAFVQAIKYRCRKAVIHCDGKEIFCGKLFTATIGIGKYTGGGLSQTPYAVIDDGLFDLTIIPKMNRLRLFSRFGTLYSDNIYNINGVTLHRGARFDIHSDTPISVELDGEILGVSDFTFEIVPCAIKVIVSQKYVVEN